jgi:hypothetical protein
MRAVSLIVAFVVCAATSASGQVKDPNQVQVDENESLSTGPDTFGYECRDETESGGPTFGFVDISGTGTAVGLGDDTAALVPLGLTFNFYGNDFTQVYFSSNGFLTFTNSGTTDFTNDCPVPNALVPNDAIYVLWDDLTMVTGSGYRQTFGSCPNTSGGSGPCTVFMWDNADFFGGGTDSFDIEAILYDNGNILMQYVPGALNIGLGATVGLEAPGAVDGLTHVCNVSGSIVTGRAILCNYPGAPLPRGPSVPALGPKALGAVALILAILGVVTLRKRHVAHPLSSDSC